MSTIDLTAAPHRRAEPHTSGPLAAVGRWARNLLPGAATGVPAAPAEPQGTAALQPQARLSPSVAAPAAPAEAPRAAITETGYTIADAAGSWWTSLATESAPELQWPRCNGVYDRMRRSDAQVTSVLRAVSLPVRRTAWFIDPAGARDEVVQMLAADLGLPIHGEGEPPLSVSGTPGEPSVRLGGGQRRRGRFSWSAHLKEVLEYLTYGHSYFEQVYRLDEDGYARLRKLAPRPAKTLTKIDVAADGGLIGIEQNPLTGGEEPPKIPVSRLVAYVHEASAGDWYGTSLLRPAYKNWLLKDRALRVQMETLERNGMGVPDYEAAETEQDLAKGLAQARQVRSSATGAISRPNGSNFTLRGVTGNLPDADVPIRYHDEQIGRAVLAHFLNLGTQTGSWALGSTFADFFTMSLQTVAEQIADVTTAHVVEDWVDVNFGPTEPAPRIAFQEIGSRQAATASAITLLVREGILTADEGLEQAVRFQYGLPSQRATAAPAPASAPAPPPPAQD